MSLNSNKIPIAINRRTKLDLSCEHITTMNFMQLQPVFYRHMIKGEHLTFNVLATCRPAPIEVPLYGRMRLNMRGFYIPYRLCMPNWHEYYNDSIASNYGGSSLVSNVPRFNTESLVQLFTSYATLSSAGTSSDYDLKVGANYYKYTKLGRLYLKILESLGYKVIPNTSKSFYYNAFGLLAMAKAYIDWYANAQYLNSADVLFIEQLLHFNDPASNLELDAAALYSVLGLIYTTVYNSDEYLTAAWDNPVSPNTGQYSVFSMEDPTNDPSVQARVTVDTATANGTPYMKQSATSVTSVGTEYIHQALRRLTSFQKRHALAGARAIDRVLAQYGISNDSLRLTRSIYVGSQSIDIQIGTVFGTSNSTNSDGTTSSVGDFAGSAFGQGDKSWDFQSDDEGIFMVLASITPVGNIVQGYDRNNRHLEKTDFFVPEFDQLSVQVLEKGEVFVGSLDTFASDANDYAAKFGYVGRYGEYKRPLSFVTGDLSPSNKTHYLGASSWHLMRLFDERTWSNDITNCSHSLSFTRGADAFQYDRIFQFLKETFDKFYVDFHFDVAAYAPCAPLFDTYEFEEANSSKSVTVSANGSTLD